MNAISKTALKILSNAYINVKKHYKLYRRIHALVHPHFKPVYHTLDRKLAVGDREIPLRVFYPKTDAIPKIIIFFHGGGWVTGNIDSYTNICAFMAEQTKRTVISVNYRLAPENPFPAGLEDCYYVTKELLSNPGLLRCGMNDITLIGDSAGGNLAAAVSLMARDRGEFLPCKQILIYPATNCDHSEHSPYQSIRDYGSGYLLTAKRIQSYMELYIQNNDACNPYIAPLMSTDLMNQPKTLVITAEYDPLRDEGEAYGRKLREFHNDVCICRINGAIHGFLALPRRSKHIEKCYEMINRFLREEELPDEAAL